MGIFNPKNIIIKSIITSLNFRNKHQLPRILYRKFNEQRSDWSSDLLIIPMNNLIQPLYFIDGETEAQTTGGVYIQLPFLDSRLLQCHGEFQRSVWCGEKKRRGHFFKSLSDIGKWVKSKN